MTKFAHELDVIVLMTDWKDFLNIDVEHLAKNMKHKIVVDSKNFLDMNLYKKHGFTYLGVGIQ